MKKPIGIIALALSCGAITGLSGCGATTNAVNNTRSDPQTAHVAVSEASPETSTDYNSPLVTLRADPYLYKHEGKYYFTGSYPEYDRIELTCADSVNGIAAAEPKTVWTMPDPVGSKYVWAPELHYIMGEWVIYYAFSIWGLWDIRCCALKCTGDDPMNDEWVNMGVMQKSALDDFSFNDWGFSLDMTVFENNGSWYAIWAQKGPSSNLYIAELETPFKLKSKPQLLTKPEYEWELKRQWVNEGPAVLKHGGKIFVSFSASATGYEYCMGLLEVDAAADLLDMSNWTKYSEPVFKTDNDRKIYGPGHNCFTEGDDGEPICVLHFRDYLEITIDSLNDFNRHAHVMKMKFDSSGKPIFDFSDDELYNTPFTDHK